MRKLGRNDPCACGSGKKHKHCCQANARSQASAPRAEKVTIPAALQRAIECYRVGRWPQAEIACQEILSSDPDQADALHLAGLIANQQGNNLLAVSFINRAIAANPAEAVYYSNLGNALKAAGQLEEAVVNYRKAIAIKPDFADALNNLGLALHEGGQLEQAVVSYREALAIKPDGVESCYNLGNALKALGRLEEAVACYRRALTLRPDYADAHCNLGVVYEERGELEQAIASYRHALAIRPNSAEMHNNLGNVFEKQGKLDDAAACYNQALMSKPDLAEPYLNLASMLMSVGRISEAGTLFGLGLARVRKDGWRIAGLAAVADWMMGLYDEAQVLVSNYLAAALSAVSDSYNVRQRIFITYIGKLLEYREARPSLYASERETAPLTVLGDSHSLSPANTVFDWCGTRVTASSAYIPGIKMFHLGESAKRQYAMYLAAQLRAIAPVSHLLFAIGEIDCRPNEGIWTAYRKRHDSLSEVIASSVAGYLDAIADEIADKSFASVTVQGIPAPAYALTDKFDPGDKPAFLAMVGSVNDQLRSGALSRGWQFLDVYAATVASDGSSNGKWDLDGFHLLPAFYAEAMQWMRV